MNIPRDKKFFEHGEWLEILAEKNINEHTKEIFSRFVRESIEDGYRWEYYRSLEFMSQEGPDWEDLTEEQRERIRQTQNEHARAMQAFGEAISSGNMEEIDRAGRKMIGK